MNYVETAQNAQAESDTQSRADQPDLLSLPPTGYEPIDSIFGEQGAFNSAEVVGYRIGEPEPITDYTYKGRPFCPGDDGFLEMIQAKMIYGRLLPGVTKQTRQARFLYARIVGNPILLENQARQRGYPHALATVPGWLKMGEIHEQEG